jgi:hypothetical protein
VIGASMKVRLQVRLVVSALLSLSLSMGQTRDMQSTPKVDDPELYYTFFYLYQDLSKWIEKHSAADRVKGDSILKDVRGKFHVDEIERVRLNGMCQEITSRLAANRDAGTAYMREREAAGLSADPAALREFSIRRMSIIEDGERQIRASLSAEAWKGVQGFINGPHRAGVKKMIDNKAF